MLKRTFDIIFSSIIILISLPLMLGISIWIKAGSRGPVFYKGIRIGKGGMPFRMLKFRSMVVDADKIGGHSTANDDARLTEAGTFLRRYKLDELPQFINVLKGEMSFVGPRPEVPFYTDMFTEKEKEILSVRPGITDWASLWNSDEGAILAGSPDPEKTYMEKIRPKKIELQLKYVKERSFWTDLKIIFLTLRAVLTKESLEI